MKLAERGEREAHRVPTGRDNWIGTLSPDFIRGYFHVFAPGRGPWDTHGFEVDQVWATRLYLGFIGADGQS